MVQGFLRSCCFDKTNLKFDKRLFGGDSDIRIARLEHMRERKGLIKSIKKPGEMREKIIVLLVVEELYLLVEGLKSPLKNFV